MLVYQRVKATAKCLNSTLRLPCRRPDLLLYVDSWQVEVFREDGPGLIQITTFPAKKRWNRVLLQGSWPMNIVISWNCIHQHQRMILTHEHSDFSSPKAVQNDVTHLFLQPDKALQAHHNMHASLLQKFKSKSESNQVSKPQPCGHTN